jgi:hypothetical protein
MKRRWDIFATVVGTRLVGQCEADTSTEALAVARKTTNMDTGGAGEIEAHTVEKITVECGADVAEIDFTEGDWQVAARKAGWTPPKDRGANRGLKRGARG